jgi:hypothetical protein
MPWQPEGIWQVVYNSEQWVTSPGEDRYRRGIYTFLRRTSPYPSMITYDAPTGEVCTIRRIRTNTPLQALATLNDPVSMEAAQRLALRTLESAEENARARAERMFSLTLARPPRTSEIERVLALHAEASQELKGQPERAQKLLRYGETIYPGDRAVTLIEKQAPGWKYTLTDPGAQWFSGRFDAAGWSQGKGQFGYFPKPPEDVKIGTPWESDDLWLRMEFNAPAEALERPRMIVRCQGSFEAYLNGVLAANVGLERNGYYEYAVEPEAARTLKAGRNVLAARVRRTREKSAGQIMDVGLVAARALDLSPRRADDIDRAAWVVVANTLLNLDETLTRR